MTEPLIFELSRPGREGATLPELDVPDMPTASVLPPQCLRQKEPRLPEAGETDVVRHFTRLSTLNYGVDNGFYPLGSCTMKYNPKVNEAVARLSGLSRLHPYQPESTVQGALEIFYQTQEALGQITGMDAFSLQPAAGAHGELTGMMIIRAYHQSRGEKRTKVIVPDSAHGTNPASAAMCGFEVVEVKSNARGGVDLEALRRAADGETAALMLTNPNTLGLFEEDILAIAEIVHSAGALLYYDGANLNAIMGYARPGDMGFDVMHLNLHKTFSTPHGGGGPGSGPVGVKDFLKPFLPVPVVAKQGDSLTLDYDRPQSIGQVKAFYGNFGVIVKAYAYIIALGGQGLKEVSENAVLNANYLMSALKDSFHVPYGQRRCKHEYIMAPKDIASTKVHTLDVAKRLLDYGYHPPTVYFPLIVEEAMMVEPTETESMETLDQFISAMKTIARESQEDPNMVKGAPYNTPVSRLDEVGAARKPVVRWEG